jgi:amidohydrolase
MKQIRRLAAAAALVPAAAGAQASITDAQVTSAVERHAPAIVGIRHRIHQHPELGNRETKTAEVIAAHLRALGMEVRTGVAHTGVIGVLKGALPGPVVAVRADMDALPVTENTDLPFKSTVRATYNGQEVGVMHACGHDIHVAVQLGVASTLAGMRDRLPGTVLFVFQPAEEGPPLGEKGGAKLMLEEGAFANPKPSAVFGLHSFAAMEVGKVGWIEGPAFAAATEWRATVRGKQAHGASPEESIDPIVTASQVVTSLQTIRARNLSPFTPSVVTVGIMRGGERLNIIPAEVKLEGTVRTFDVGVQDVVERRMREVFDGVTRANGGSFTLEFNRAYPLTVNDTTLARRSRPTMERVLGRANVVHIPPVTGGEDFSYFANTVPGFFYRLGTTKPGTVSGGHHTPTFRADDASIPVGMRVMSTLLLDYLAQPRQASDR